MIKVTILYPKTAGGRFDFAYYASTHMPESIRRLGPAMTAISVERGIDPGAPWPASGHEAICCFTCESQAAYEAAFFPHAEWLQADMANYTDIPPVIQITEIVLTHP